MNEANCESDLFATFHFCLAVPGSPWRDSRRNARFGADSGRSLTRSGVSNCPLQKRIFASVGLSVLRAPMARSAISWSPRTAMVQPGTEYPPSGSAGKAARWLATSRSLRSASTSSRSTSHPVRARLEPGHHRCERRRAMPFSRSSSTTPISMSAYSALAKARVLKRMPAGRSSSVQMDTGKSNASRAVWVISGSSLG